MFEITTYPALDLESDLREELSPEELALIRPALERPSLDPPCDHPWVQLSYREIPMEFVDTALAYANIAKTNSPVGLDGTFTPIARRGESVVFPVSGLEAHLEHFYPEQLAALRAAGEPQRFLHSPTHEYSSSTEYFLAGLLACIFFSRTYGHAIVFTW